MRQCIICREPLARIGVRVKPGQVVEKRDLISDDRSHRRSLYLTVITRGNAGEKLALASGLLTRTRRSGSQLALVEPSCASAKAASMAPSGTGRCCRAEKVRASRNNCASNPVSFVSIIGEYR